MIVNDGGANGAELEEGVTVLRQERVNLFRCRELMGRVDDPCVVEPGICGGIVGDGVGGCEGSSGVRGDLSDGCEAALIIKCSLYCCWYHTEESGLCCEMGE